MKNTLLGLMFLASVLPAFALDVNVKYGQSGNSVFELQDFLVSKGFLTVNPTGFFGLITLSAVKQYQTSVDLPSTGFVGPLTRGKINEEVATLTASSTEAEVQETGTTTPISMPISTGSAPVEAVVQAPVVVPVQPVEIPYGTLLAKPDIGTDETRADVFIDQAQIGDIVTTTFQGVTNTTVIGNGNFHGGRIAYFNLATGLTPSTLYTYDIKTQRGNQFSQGSFSFTTK